MCQLKYNEDWASIVRPQLDCDLALSASKKMRNDIASFEKTSRSRVKIIENINAEFIFVLNFPPNIT